MITQQEIARKLGLSRQLVSLALAGYPQVSADSRHRILATARKMGYRPNPHARALKRGRTGLVALWIPNQISAHYGHVSREFSRLVKQAKRRVVGISRDNVIEDFDFKDFCEFGKLKHSPIIQSGQCFKRQMRRKIFRRCIQNSIAHIISNTKAPCTNGS